jgi:hypothetical protein
MQLRMKGSINAQEGENHVDIAGQKSSAFNEIMISPLMSKVNGWPILIRRLSAHHLPMGLGNRRNEIQTASQPPHNAPQQQIEHVEGNVGTPESGPGRT